MNIPSELLIAQRLLETATYILTIDDSDEKWDGYELLVNQAQMYLSVGLSILETGTE